MTMLTKLLATNPHNNYLGKYLYELNGLFIWLFFVFTFLFWGGTGYPFAAILLLTPLAFFVKRPYKITRIHGCYITALLLMFLINLIAKWRGNEFSIEMLDQPMRFALFIPIGLYLLKIGYRECWLWAGIYSAGIICGFESLTFSSGEYGTRASGPFNPINWGNIAAVIMCIAGIRFLFVVKQIKTGIKTPKNYSEAALAALAAAGALAGVALSGARGSWLALLFVACIYLVTQAKHLRLKTLTAMACAIIIIPIVLYNLPATKIKPRIDAITYDLSNFELGTGPATSSGLRLEMWYTSLIAFKQAPIIGLGTKDLTELEKELVKEQKVHSWVATQSSQQHSDIMDTMAKNGLVGLMILGLFYFSTYQLSKITTSSVQANSLKLITLLHLGFGLTNTILVGMNGTMFLLGTSAALFTTLNTASSNQIER